jgi:archaemetzincin
MAVEGGAGPPGPPGPPGSPGQIEGLRFLVLDDGARARTVAVAARVSGRLALPCRLDPAPPCGALPRLEVRDQVDADAALGVLAARPRSPAEVLVGVTGLDMGSPLFTHFFGRAEVGARVALVSLARLEPAFHGLPDEPARALRRAEAEVLHEVGHAVGLRHCERWDCLMHFAATVEALDLRGRAYCPACAAGLPSGLLASRETPSRPEAWA